MIIRICRCLCGFFLNILPDRRRRRAPATMEGSTPPPAKKPTLRVVKPRAPARPHRKLPDDVLKVRITEAKKRLQVLQSRAVLMTDRLEAYEKEEVVRAPA